jgi:hypothetical protein
MAPRVASDAMLIAVTVLAVGRWLRPWLAEALIVVIPCLVTAFVAALVHDRRRAHPVTEALDARRWRVARWLIVPCVLLGLRAHACVHARTIFVGPIGLSYSDTGGPCHNGPHGGGDHLVGQIYVTYWQR